MASATLAQRIEAAAERGGGLRFVGPDPSTSEWVPWADLHHEARGVAAALQARGVEPGDHVALIGPTSRPLVTAIQATWLAGATAVVLPLPMRLGSLEEFVVQTRARVRMADIKLLLVDPELAAFLPADTGDPPMVPFPALWGRADDLISPSPDPERLATLQFTSGSTSEPKGVMLADRHILANLDGAVKAAELDVDSEVMVSWLPLYHDMGLIGLLTIPMITGIELVLAGPQDFMTAPGRWLEWMSHYRGTATAGPNFSYALAARALRRTSGLDLSCWRIALNGAEPVDPGTIEAFCGAAEPHGFRAEAAFPAFGMAEVAIAGTFPEPGSGLRVDVVDRRLLETERYAAPVMSGPQGRAFDRAPARPARLDRLARLARLGRPVAGLEVRICDPQTGSGLDDREVGELQIRGTSVTPGYYNQPGATAEAFMEGWLRTGDLAYLAEGELVVCGRLKDMIIVGGRNVFPEDVERAVASIEGIRAGNVIAFGIEGRKGREVVVVVAETREEDHRPIRQAVSVRVLEAVGVPAEEIVLVPPGTLPKTSSGKLQRSLCRTRYLDAQLHPVS